MGMNRLLKRTQPMVTRPVLGVYASTPVVIIEDAFTDSDATALTAHTIAPTNTPSATWTKLETAAAVIVSNKAQPSTYGVLTCDIVDSGKADCVIEADFQIGGTDQTNNLISIVFRATDNNNRWSFIMTKTGLSISERTSSTNTTRATDAGYSYSALGSYHFKVTLAGNSITCEVSGDYSATLTYSSSVRNTATKHGVRMITDGGTTTGISKTDNFKVSV